MSDKSAILARIKEYYGFNTDIDLANFLGIQRSTVSNWVKRNSIDYDLVFSKCVHMDKNWLLNGQESMLRETPAENTTPQATPVLASNKKNKGDTSNAPAQEHTHIIDKLFQETKELHSEIKELSSQNAVLEFMNRQLTEEKKEAAKTIADLHENVRTLMQKVEALEKREKSSVSTSSQLPAEKTVPDLPVPSSMIVAEPPVEYKRQCK
jgi:uncharacterized coiled-coil protein SlyX